MPLLTARFADIRSHNRPSLFATPLAWAATELAGRLIETAGDLARHHTALLVISDACSMSTIRELRRSATRGVISPLKFAGASPSIVAGVPALQYGLRGPTVTLTMRPEHAAGAVVSLIQYWFTHCIAAVIAIAHHETEDGSPLFRGLLAKSDDGDIKQSVLRLCERTDSL